MIAEVVVERAGGEALDLGATDFALWWRMVEAAVHLVRLLNILVS